MRSILAVLAGAGVWAVLWLGLNQGLLAFAPDTFAPGEPITSGVALLGVWLSSVVFSVFAGWVTGIVARGQEVTAATILGVLQLGLGIFFQAQSWDLMPLWYHLLFLVCLMPGNVYGGWLRSKQA